MRILLVFIIILNLLYAGWEVLDPVAKKKFVPAFTDSLKTLELLNEEKIDLLKSNITENEVAKIAGQDKGPDLHKMESEEQAGSITCYTLGPFKDENIMQQLRESIAEYVSELSVRKRLQSIKHRYWVYVPALANKKQAKLMAKRLRQKKINDFYIVLSGEAKYSISLGHFREPAHANRRVKKVVALGFKSEIKVIYREYEIYWLDYQVDSEEGGSSFSVDEYLSDGVSQLVRDCHS